VTSLVWVLHDYRESLKEIWQSFLSSLPSRYLSIRYYTILLVLGDVIQTHGFAIIGVTSLDRCLAIETITRMAGAISLWSVEIIMQMRIYFLYNRSKKIALVNMTLFAVSISAFVAIMVINGIRFQTENQWVTSLPPYEACPPLRDNSIAWTLWMPGLVFELVLFGYVIHKSIVSTMATKKINGRTSLAGIILKEHMVYFFIVSCILVFNNLMTVGATRIPWFGLGPLHAALGITTGRMLIHLRKFASKHLAGGPGDERPSSPVVFAGAPAIIAGTGSRSLFESFVGV
ncbi:hypothetical protein CPC08DRAFT_796352, partial [Agrocybe pediades]